DMRASATPYGNSFTLSHERSTKRFHSVHSQSLSPATRRKKPRKHLLNTDNAKNKIVVYNNLDEKIKSHAPLSSVEEFKQEINQFLQNVSSQKIKIIPRTKDNKSDTDIVNKEASVLTDSPIVEVILSELKTEPECDDTVISETVVSDLVEETSAVDADLESSLHSWTSGKSKVDKFDNQAMDEICEKLRQMDEICFPETSSHKSFSEVAKEIDEINDDDNRCQLEMSVSEDTNELDSKKIIVSQASRQIDEMKFKFSCRICSFKSTRENHYIKHMKLHDKGLALYKCAECSFVSIRASHLRRHKMTHAQQVLSCNLCAYTCDDQKLLTKHIRVKHQEKSVVNDDGTVPTPSTVYTVYECSECNYKTSWHYAFLRHSRTHQTSKLDTIHACPDCPYKTIRREHFLRHIKNVHQNHRPFLCDVCGKAFKRQDALKQHHVTHYPHFGDGTSSTYGYVCHICQKVCRSTAYLKEHMATHSEERSFLCEICGACFKTRSVQRNHVQTIHRRPRAFTCLQCDKKFNTKFALRRHMKQHETTPEDNSERSQSEIKHTTSRMKDVYGNICEKEFFLTEVGQQIYQQSQTSNSNGSSPAYHITIDGQPAYLLPIKESGTSTGHHAVTAATTTGDTGGIVVHKGSHRKLGDGVTSKGQTNLSAADTVNPHSQLIPIMPHTTTVHIVNSQTEGARTVILGPDHYDTQRTATVAVDDTAAYVTQHSNNTTILYLSNFT
ncbi:unnamed protein product, partial [Meganyctiphanes norvegica]